MKKKTAKKMATRKPAARKKLDSALAKAEGGKHQAMIGDVRQITKAMEEIFLVELLQQNQNGEFKQMLERLQIRLSQHFKEAVYVNLQVGFAKDEFR